MVGNSVTLYINGAPGTSHTATWALGSYASSQIISTGVTGASFTIPSTWSNAIAGTSATGRVTLFTYASDGAFVGSNTYNFTVTLAAGATAPSIGNVTITHIPGAVPTAWGCFLQGKSKA